MISLFIPCEKIAYKGYLLLEKGAMKKLQNMK
jgi:hypothetical protein